MSTKNSSNSIAGNAVFNLIYRLLNILFPLISAGYAARILMPEGIGRNAEAQNNVSYFLVIAMLGIPAYATRELARHRGDKKETDKIFSEILVLNACLTTVAILLFGICLYVLDLFKSEFALYAICGITLYVNFINIDWYYQATEQFRFIALRSLIVKSVSLVLLFIFVRDVDDLYVYALLTSLAVCGHYIINIVNARRTLSFSFKDLNLRRHLKSLSLLAFCTISTEIYARLDITMLGIMKDSSTVAYYTYAQKIINLTSVFIISITAVFLPRLSYYFSKDNEAFNRLAKIGSDLMIFMSFPVCFGIASVAYPLVLVWLGNDYMDVVPCLIMLAFIIPLKCIGDIACYQVMICAGQEFVLMFSYAVTLAVNLVCNLLLIPEYGAFGACIASFISEIVVFVFVLCFARKYQNYRIDKYNAVVVIISSLVMLASVLLVQTLTENLILKLLIGTATGVLVFVVLNIITRNSFFKDEFMGKIKDLLSKNRG